MVTYGCLSLALCVCPSVIPGKDVRCDCDYLRWYRMASAVTTVRLELANCQQTLNFQSAKEACMSMLLCVC